MSVTRREEVAMGKQEFAKQAEDLTCEFLCAQGWRILARNFRAVGSELDIIAQKQKSLIIVEVKARAKTSNRANEFLLMMNNTKKNSLIRGCKLFLAQRYLCPQSIRFDLAIVTPRNGRLHIDYRVGVME